MNKLVFIIFLTALTSGCATTKHDTASTTAPVSDAEKHLIDGVTFVNSGSINKAIDELNQAIEICDNQYSDKKTKVFSSRGQTETIYYMLLASAENIQAIAVNTTCSDALYFRGYVEMDRGNLEVAQTYVERAIAMAPVNSRYLSELGHIHQTNKKWNDALEVFSTSEESADIYSPDSLKNKELMRAKRGVAFALTELNRIDEAESKYKECLAIDPNDKNSLHELEYLKILRTKK
jgi:tetratricopeptide (TPR) repeat protein